MSARPRCMTAYCLDFHNWTPIPHQIDWCFADMAQCGFTAVALSFSESEMRYGRRTFELLVARAHAAGLQALVIPSRLGGRFAGAPLMPSPWLERCHPECAVPEAFGVAGRLACVESAEFRAWICAFMTTVLTDYPLDGIVWDEPKAVDTLSSHPATRARFGPQPTHEEMATGFVEFLTMLVAHCHAVRPGLAQTLFVQQEPPYFSAPAARIPGLAYFGRDGNLCRQSSFHEEPRWEKYRIESVWARTKAECAAAGVGSFALVENMLMPAAAHDEYAANLDAYLQGDLPDHLGLYYYAHNNEDPEGVMAITRAAMRRYL